jgi:hypothetical protein
MAENPSEDSESFSNGSREMTFTAQAVSEELTGNVKSLVEASPELSIKGRLRAVSRRIGLPISRIEDYWYGEVRRPPAHEADQIRAYYKSATKLIQARQDYDQFIQEALSSDTRLGLFLPPTLDKSRGEIRAEAAVASEMKRKRSRK